MLRYTYYQIYGFFHLGICIKSDLQLQECFVSWQGSKGDLVTTHAHCFQENTSRLPHPHPTILFTLLPHATDSTYHLSLSRCLQATKSAHVRRLGRLSRQITTRRRRPIRHPDKTDFVRYAITRTVIVLAFANTLSLSLSRGPFQYPASLT